MNVNNNPLLLDWNIKGNVCTILILNVLLQNEKIFQNWDNFLVNWNQQRFHHLNMIHKEQTLLQSDYLSFKATILTMINNKAIPPIPKIWPPTVTYGSEPSFRPRRLSRRSWPDVVLSTTCNPTGKDIASASQESRSIFSITLLCLSVLMWTWSYN